MQAGTETLEGSAYLSDIATLFAGYTAVRDRLGRRRLPPDRRRGDLAAARLGRVLGGAPGLPLRARRPDAQPVRVDRSTLASRRRDVCAALRRRALCPGRPRRAAQQTAREIGIAEETRTEADPANTDNPFLFHIEREFGAIDAETLPPSDGLTLLRSAGERGEAEAIGVEVAKLVAGGADPAEIAIVLRDPARRGPLVASVLESYGIATALEAELPVAGTAVGGGLIALLEAEFGAQRASDLLRFLRGPSGAPPGKVDWLERAIRRGRVRSAADALELWSRESGDLPPDLARLRKAAEGSPAATRRGGRPACREDRISLAAGGIGDRDRDCRAGVAGGSGDIQRARPTSARWATSLHAPRNWPGCSRKSGSAPGAARSGGGCGSPTHTACAPGASTTYSSARFRMASSPAATGAATPSSPSNSATRSASTRAATPTPRSATSSTSASRCRARASSSPTGTAMRTAPRRLARRCSTMSAACWRRRRAARARTQSRSRSCAGGT